MLDILWAFMLITGILTAAFTGNLEAVSSSVLDSAGEAVDLLITMAGVITIWSGFLSIAEGSGLTASLAGNMRPLLRLFFPRIPDGHPAMAAISSNFIANILGLGWACTPTGLTAMDALKDLHTDQGGDANVASDEMCAFLLLNISSLQLIPINMIAYRARYGSPAPMAIVGPSLAATLITTLAAALICQVMTHHRPARKS